MKDIAVTPERVLQAYRQGLFPMADSAEDERLFWYDPPLRGILPIDGLHVPRRLQHTILKTRPYIITADRDFSGVIGACAQTSRQRPKTWINKGIVELYTALARQGHAHSVEAWDGNELVGGVYGIAIGGAFFGESMFSRKRDASKIALVHLVAHLWKRGFTLFDTQFANEHIAQFGVYEIPRADYLRLLSGAVGREAPFFSGDGVNASGSVEPSGAFSSEKDVLPASGVAAFLQSMTQTS